MRMKAPLHDDSQILLREEFDDTLHSLDLDAMVSPP